MKIFYTFLFFIFSLQQPLLANNVQYEQHQDIKRQVAVLLNTAAANLGGDITININNIDQRLRLKKCPIILDISTADGTVKAGRNTIQVRCESVTPWRIFMTSRITVLKKVVLTNKPLTKGHLLTASDIHLKKVDISKAPLSYFQDQSSVVNKITKRNLREGTILSANILTKPLLIKRGDSINIIAANKGFKITMKGIAMSAGSKGEKIKVKNIRTKKIIHGIITDKHTVKVSI